MNNQQRAVLGLNDPAHAAQILTSVLQPSSQEPLGMDRSDIFAALRAQGFGFLRARDTAAFALGDMRYPTFTRAGVHVAIQSGRCLEDDRGTVMVYESERTDVVIWGLRTDPTCRRQGHAAGAMRSLLKCADFTGVTLYLEPVPLEEHGMTVQQLQSFYRKLGFEPTVARCRVMKREPQPAHTSGAATSP